MRDPIYLDNAATTPVRAEVREAMSPFFSTQFGNPSSPHSFGRAARSALDNARRKIADLFGIVPAGVVFTSGGTEADNLAVLGGALAARDRGARFAVATGASEHKAVLAASYQVAHLGGDRVVVEVDGEGSISHDSLEAALSEGAGVVSVMWVNNETGVIQDIEGIAQACRGRGATFHTDAVQALGKVPCPLDSGWDMLTLSGHKIGAPKGIGALLLRDSDLVQPLFYGGGQQLGVRSGTENVTGAIGLATAVELAAGEIGNTKQMGLLRDRLEQGICAAFPDTVIASRGAPRAPHVCNVCIPGTDSESLLMHLDLAGVACSSGSACDSGAVEPSHVLRAMGFPDALALAALRFSLASSNTGEHIDRVLQILPDIVTRVRQLGRALGRQE